MYWKVLEKTVLYHSLGVSNPEDVTTLQHPAQLKLLEGEKRNCSDGGKQMFAGTMKGLDLFSRPRYNSRCRPALGTKGKRTLLYLLSFAGWALPPREIKACAFTNRANGRHAYLFYIYLQCSQELKISPEMKAYVGIKSRSCSSLTANHAFRTLLAGVFMSVAFPETQRCGRGGKGWGRRNVWRKTMKGSLERRFWPRGQEDARFPKAAVCRGTKQIKDINKTSIVGVQIHDHGWFTLMHLKPSIILFA